MAATYEPIQTYAITSNTQTVTFSSIPQTYTDLRLTVSGTNLNASGDVYLQYNGVTTTSYGRVLLRSSGAAASAAVTTNATSIQLSIGGMDTVTPSLYTVDIFDYTNTGAWKSSSVLVSETLDGVSGGWLASFASTFRSNTNISSILVGTSSTNRFISGSTITLWGIKAA
jgi:hypothetical protein